MTSERVALRPSAASYNRAVISGHGSQQAPAFGRNEPLIERAVI